MYSVGTYGNTSFVVFPYLSRVEMTNRQPIHGIARLALANMMDYVACPRAATAAPDIAEFWINGSYVTKNAAAFH
jgi:hypothetical protein